MAMIKKSPFKGFFYAEKLAKQNFVLYICVN